MRLRVILGALFLFASAAAAQTLKNDDCLACHDSVSTAKSIHGSLDCTNCHADVTAVPHEAKPKAVECSTCHSDEVAAHDSSRHPARCADCHGRAHQITPTLRASVPKMCSRCHAQKFAMEKAGLSPQPAMSYSESVHGRAVAKGSTKAAVCTDCHDSHAVKPANDPQSGIFKFNVARTCGKCHAAIAAQYGEGIHGKALAHGNWSAPVCTDCHGIHTIARTTARASCVHCHEGVRLTQEFAVPANRVTTYQQSYHGLARKMGSAVAADCASCHGAHDIRPSSDPKSAISPVNLTKTCGKCHPGAPEKFIQGKIHLTKSDVGDFPAKINTWIRRIYIFLIIATIGFMVLHNLIIWVRKVQLARRKPDRVVVRMNLNQRIQHIILLVSFTVLVISGFALAWPDSLFAGIFGPNEELRRTVHRIAAVIMIALGLYHIAYLALTKEGRQLFRDLWVRFKDGRDLLTVFKYYLGLTREKPEFGRFTYAEKMEYWAGMWGTIVMALTGLVIWYALEIATWIPRWWIDIATTIHFYEAILATLAILVWHFYQVIFDPDVYPMNLAWFDGKMSKEQFHEEHGLVTPKPEEQPS
jgi:cytochrome b subunit of formate dehydrogenase